MRITRISVENFGIYKGICEFNFTYDPHKRVTLLRGENGSGKTTLLNSIKTVLYGSMLMGSYRQNNSKYSDYIERSLNTEAKKNPHARYSIEVNITANMQQFSGNFQLIRSWNLVSKKVQEEFLVFKGDQLLDESETEEFSKVFYRLYPLELFELFYLDGEKIDQLSFFDSNIHKLIESTMNIDLFKTLRSDLESYAIKKHRTAEVERIKKEKEYSLNLKNHLHEKIEDNRKKLIELKLIEQQTQSTIDQINKGIISSNQNMPELITRKNEEILRLKKDVARQVIETIPLLLLENEINQMTLQLREEMNASKAKIIRESLNESLIDDLIAGSPHLSKKDVEEIFKLIRNQFMPADHIIHDINFDEHKELSALISRITPESKSNVKALYERYYGLIDEVKKLNEKMTNYDATRVEELLSELNSTNQVFRETQLKIAKLQEQTDLDQIQIKSLEMKLSNQEAELWKAIKSENVNNVISKISDIIEIYVKKIKSKKISSIEILAKDMFENLIRKKGFIQNVVITENEIYLVTGDGDNLPVNSLSSGEKQLFVLSIIYALVKVSARSTPLIFDTLLGRLDKNHQQEVMEKFIAKCPDQVIILATDSELENIKPETIESLVKTKYSIDLSRHFNRIEMII